MTSLQTLGALPDELIKAPPADEHSSTAASDSSFDEHAELEGGVGGLQLEVPRWSQVVQSEQSVYQH